jgi:transcriptional regulator with XRE-family HTH domain
MDDETRARVADLIGDSLDRAGRGSRARLAKATGVTAATITKWTQRHTVPEITKWQAIEAELDLEPGSIAQAAGFDVTESVVSLRSELAAIRESVEELGDEIRRLLGELLEVVSEDTPGDR